MIAASSTFFSAAISVVFGCASGGEIVWRDISHGPVNCLYLVLRLNDVDVRYDKLLMALPPSKTGRSLAELAEAGRKSGLRLKPEKLSLTELVTRRYSIVHFSDRLDSGGTYAVLVKCTDVSCHVLIGPSAEYVSMPIEAFRRHWSGFVLTPSQRVATTIPGFLAVMLTTIVISKSIQAIGKRNE